MVSNDCLFLQICKNIFNYRCNSSFVNCTTKTSLAYCLLYNTERSKSMHHNYNDQENEQGTKYNNLQQFDRGWISLNDGLFFSL